MALSARSIIYILVCILVTPVHIYGCFKFRQFQWHFFIKYRFPEFVIIVSITTLIWNYTLMIGSCLEDNGVVTHILESFIVLLSYISVNMIFYRAHLVYLQYLQQNNALSDGNNVPKKVAPQYSSRSLLIFIFITTLFVFIAPILNIYNTATIIIFIEFVVGIIYITVIKCRGTEERLGIFMDIAVSTVMIAVLSLFHVIPNPDPYVILRPTIEIITANIMAIFPLLYALLLFLKNEGSLKPVRVLNKKYPYQNPDNHRGFYSETDMDKMPLFVFLRKEDNYNTFRSYLCQVFAVENIKFVTNALVLYHSVHLYKAKSKFYHSVVLQKEHEEHEAGADIKTSSTDNCVLYSLRFEYLESKNQKYKSFMMKNVTSRDPIFYDLRDNVWSLCKDLYERFIVDDAPERIAIRYKTQQHLSALMGNEDSKDKFQCFADFLHLYHDALIDAWNGMEICYGFGFKEYLMDVGNQMQSKTAAVHDQENIQEDMDQDIEVKFDEEKTQDIATNDQETIVDNDEEKVPTTTGRKRIQRVIES